MWRSVPARRFDAMAAFQDSSDFFNASLSIRSGTCDLLKVSTRETTVNYFFTQEVDVFDGFPRTGIPVRMTTIQNAFSHQSATDFARIFETFHPFLMPAQQLFTHELLA